MRQRTLKLVDDGFRPEKEKGIVQIRRASIQEMLEVWKYQGFDTVSPTAQFFSRNIEKGNAVFWTLDREGELIGELYAYLDLPDRDFADGRTTAYLCAFRIRKEYRGQGYGTMLMSKVLEELKEMDLNYVTIGVGSDEPRNIRLYKRFGFNTKIKDCNYDPCDMDENMQPRYEEAAWWLLKKIL